jgi:hypothetical protein
MHKDCIAYKKDKAIHVIIDKEMIGPVNERVAVDSHPFSKRTFDEEMKRKERYTCSCAYIPDWEGSQEILGTDKNGSYVTFRDAQT